MRFSPFGSRVRGQLRVEVLFDQNIPYGLRQYLSTHSVTSAEQAGWAQLANGVVADCDTEAQIGTLSERRSYL